MRFSINATRRIYFAFFAILAVIILYCPITHTGDAWGYAADVLQYRNHWKSLISPHHLLYQIWCNVWLPIFEAIHIDPIRGFTLMNLIVTFATLEILRSWLIWKNTPALIAQLLQLIAFGSYGMLRFATENEVYIVPLFLATLGSLILQKSKNHNFTSPKTFIYNMRAEYWGFALLGLSVLFHQSYFFWFIAFGLSALVAQIHSKHSDKSMVIAAFLSGIGVFAVYFAFAAILNKSFIDFILHDVNEGLVQTQIGLDNFLFTFINLIRTFIQVHGNQLYLLTHWRWLSIIGLGGGMLLVINAARLLIQLIKNNKINPELFKLSIIKNPVVLALFLHFGFAFFSVGNAEFMAMIPILLILILAEVHSKFNVKLLAPMAVGLWVYQGVFVILPLAFGLFNNNQLIADSLLKNRTIQPFVYVGNNAIEVGNAMEYLERTRKVTQYSDDVFIIGQNKKEIEQIKDYFKDPKHIIISNVDPKGNVQSGLDRSTFRTNEALLKIIKENKFKVFATLKVQEREMKLYELQR